MNKKVAIPFGITLAGVVLMIIMLFSRMRQQPVSIKRY